MLENLKAEMYNYITGLILIILLKHIIWAVKLFKLSFLAFDLA